MSDYKIEDMIGRVFVQVTGTVGGEAIKFIEDDGTKWIFYHEQDCCEHVEVVDITGDLQDLVGNPLLAAREDVGERIEVDEDIEYNRWTFYNFATIKGYVQIRWLGSSNGYYSETVDLKVLEKGQKDVY